MKIIYIVFICLLVGTMARAQQSQYARLKVYFDNKDIGDLARLGVACDHGEHKRGAFLIHDFSEGERQLLQNAGFRYEVLIADVVDYYENQNAGIPTKSNNCGGTNTTNTYAQPSNFALGTMGGYLTYQELLDNLDSMASKYPHLISPRAVIDSNNLTHEGRPIYWVRISDNPTVDEAEPEALYNALHHSREPLSLSQMVYYMWYLLENYATDTELQYIINNTALYFVPCINPDGYVYNQSTNPNGGGMWRKNRRNNGDGTMGVDLNRNYGYEWAHDNTGSSPTTSSNTYRGPSAFSEPETQNIRDFCIAHQFEYSINYHSYGAMVVYPWAYNDQLTPDSTAFKAYAPHMTEKNNYIYGTNMETVGYSTNGDADDWIYGEQSAKNKILSFTPEAGVGGFWPAANTIVPQSQDLVWQNLTIARLLLNYGVLENQSPALVAQTNIEAAYDLTRYGLQTGNLTVSVQPLSANIVAVGSAKVYSLAQFATVRDSIAMTLDPLIQNGDIFTYLLQVNNGINTIADTIQRTFGNYTIALQDNGNNMNNWTNSAGSSWDFTTSTFYSPSASLTDSKNGNYSNNSTNEMVLTQTIDLTNAVDASLEFFGKWDIENDYDYVQILAAGANGIYLPLCGNYTNIGTNYQDANAPLYDHIQSTWVAEQMSLNDFLGESAVSIKIKLVADNWVSGDGFYFDDFKVNVLAPMVSSNQKYIQKYIHLGQNQPNPASARVYVPFELPNDLENSALLVSNALGQVVKTIAIDSQQKGVEIDLSNWESGLYFYQLIGTDYKTQPQKMLIAK